MIDQHRRHEVSISPECVSDFGIKDDNVKPIKLLFFGAVICLVSIILTVSVMLW